MFYEGSEKSSNLRNITKTKTFQFYFKSDWLIGMLILKPHSNQPIRFEGQVYSLCQVYVVLGEIKSST